MAESRRAGPGQRTPPPASIGPYEILSPLGEGGVGVVYRARHLGTGDAVALKTVRVAAAAHISSVRREIHALTRLQHPGIVRILDGGLYEGRPWYAMELLEGHTLLDRLEGAEADATTLDRGFGDDDDLGRALTLMTPSQPAKRAAAGRLPEILTLFRRLCAPLGYLHGEGIVHRDLKPSNVFVRPDGTPVLMDFGLVGRWHGARGRATLEEAQAFAGTVAYMAPEQIRGEQEDARTDLYALGCSLYEAVTGRLPFDASSNAQILEQHLGATPVPPSRLVAGLPAALDDLILRLMAKEPRERVGHADDVAAVLATLGAQDWPGKPPPRPRSYLYHPRLHGRSATITVALHALKRASETGGLVLLGGESGVGKTSLAAELARIAQQRGFEVLTGACVGGADGDDTRGAPLHPFRPLLQRMAERCVAGGPEATERLLGRWRKLLATVEPAFAHIPFPDPYPEPPGLPAQAARERMLDALGEAIAAFARERMLLAIIDDVHGADDLSLALLERLGRPAAEGSAGSMVVLATYRSEEAGPALRALLALPRHRRLDLERLDAPEIARMVADMLGVAQAPADLADFVARESEGNPFFVGEYLRTALAAGLLFRDARGRWGRDARAAAVADLALPHTLRELVERRLGNLSEDARALVDIAAVLGRDVDLDLLIAVARARLHAEMPSEGDVLALVSDLLARHVFTERPGGALAFAHDKLRQIAYDRLPDDRRRDLHRVTAAALETALVPAAGGLPDHARLAHHHRHAGALARAVDHLEQAGEMALRGFANRDALAYFAEAARLSEAARLPIGDFRRARWERLAGEARQGLGDLSGSKEHLRRAVALLGFPEAAGRRALGVRVFGQIGRQTLHRVLAPLGAGRAATAHERRVEAARAYDLLLQVYYYEADPLPLFHATLMTLNLAERAGPSPVLASAYANTFAGLSLLPPLRASAIRYLHRAERTLERSPDRAVESYLDLVRGVFLAGQGRFADARQSLERSAAIAAELGFRRRWEEATGARAFVLMLSGDLAAALAAADEVYASAARGDEQTQCWSLLERARIKLLLRRGADATSDLVMAAALAEKLGRDERIWLEGTLALAARDRGDHALAAAAAGRALEAIRQGPPVMAVCVEAYAAVATVTLEAWRRARAGVLGQDGAPPVSASELRQARGAARAAARALDAFARVFPFARPLAAIARGDRLAALGRSARARRAWREALTAARAFGMPDVAQEAQTRLAPASEPALQHAAQRARRRQIHDPDQHQTPGP